MSHKPAPSTTVGTIGIDLGKNSFHLVRLDQRGAIVLQLKGSRAQLERRLANIPSCLIGMEACSGAHYIGRQLAALGHDVRLIPAQVMTVPGVGPIVSSAVVAAIGNGAGFTQGREFAAWLGLVPKQESTGDRTILGKISKRGNKYLRTLFVQAAHVVLARQPKAAMRGLWPWIEQT